MKIKNQELETLIGLYSKLVNAEYDDYEVALLVTKDGFKIEENISVFQKIKESLTKKNVGEDGKIKDINKFQNELNKLLLTEQEIELNKIPINVIKSIKIKGLEAKILNDHDLILK